ncbi:MAG TPA: alpha/beta hydrolase [Caldimonas sp.]|jgi:pimeloyl-ACP methyl ester carboxylesterase|nr:alpha/beta hydrolase [Caldimonas sp.]HEX2541616.1 alpha/beta hydrolase [Caldimonas sp.]
MAARLFVSALLLALGACAFDGPAPATASVKQMEVNGARLAYIEQGRGVPVVFVHGSMNDHRLWTPHVQAVSRQYRAVSFTQRYFGSAPWQTDWPKFGVKAHAADLAAFIRGLGAGPVHVVGWSYGASVGLAMVQQHPELVKSAFLYEPAHPTFVSDPADLKAIADDRAHFAPAVQAARAGDNLASARALFDLVGNRSGVFSTLPAEFQAMVVDNARTMPLLLTAQEPPPSIACSMLQQVRPTVAVARGERTRTFYRVIADTAANCMPNSRHVVVPGATHMWPGTDPAAFAETVLDFLSRQ